MPVPSRRWWLYSASPKLSLVPPVCLALTSSELVFVAGVELIVRPILLDPLLRDKAVQLSKLLAK